MYLSALDLVGALDEISDKRKKELINWIYSLQVKPDDEHGFSRCGFFGWLFKYYHDFQSRCSLILLPYVAVKANPAKCLISLRWFYLSYTECFSYRLSSRIS